MTPAAARGHLRRLWRARDAAEMQEVPKSPPPDAWLTVQTTPLSEHPSDPALAGR
jgi:muconolactone delta-isomerase